MKTKLKSLLQRLIMWAAGEDIELQINRRVSAAEKILCDAIAMKAKTLDLGNRKQWDVLRTQISALQAIDAPCGRDVGKIVIIARVGGRDIVKIVDIAPDISQHAFKDMVEEMKARYGARPEFLDTEAGKRAFTADYLGMPDSVSRAAKRDQGGILGGF